MSEQDEIINRRLKRALQSMSATPVPGFDKTLAVAEKRLRASKRRNLAVSGLAATAAVAALVLMTTMPGEVNDEYVSADVLLATTYWSAPSDVLLPTQDIDIYRDLPVLIESTEIIEGALL